MKWLLISFICMLAGGLVHAEESKVLVKPTTVTRAEYVLQKVKEADALCAQVTLAVTTEIDIGIAQENGLPMKRITERPVALCAYGEHSKTWHVIQVHLESPVPKEYIVCVKTAPTLEDRRNCILPHHVVTPGYQVEHLRGYGIVRLIFDVYAEKVTPVQRGNETIELRTRGEKLTVYRTRHLWFDDEALASGDVDRIIATLSAVNYTPYHPDFKDDGLVDIGAQFLFETVRRVREELGLDFRDVSSVRSLAFPHRTLADVVPWEIPLALAIIEQMDDKTFEADKKLATDAVFIEYALNREESFRWSQSGANAIGPLQFTERTYTSMVTNYPNANLDASFQIGARQLGNVLKAAIALIDKEIDQFLDIKHIYKRNPKLGGAFPVAAYNGSPASARALYAWLKKKGVSITQKKIELPASFKMKQIQKCPCKSVKAQKGKKKRVVDHIVVTVQNTETLGYLVKYLYLLNYLADLDLE